MFQIEVLCSQMIKRLRGHLSTSYELWMQDVRLNDVECFFEFCAASNVRLFGRVHPLPYFVCGVLV